MKPVVFLFFLIPSLAIPDPYVACMVTAHYRCKNGKAGVVRGQGGNLEVAQETARERARAICVGQVDYIRFSESSTNC